MKRLLIALLLMSCLFLTAVENDFQPRIGMGISLSHDFVMGGGYEYKTYPISFGNILLPIDVSPGFRIEPEFGFYTSRFEEESWESKHYNIRAGVGLYMLQPHGKSKTLFGIRAGIIHDEQEDNYSYNDHYLGFASGWEYYFVQNICLGGEVQLNYIMFDTSSDDVSSTMTTTRALLFLKYFY